MWSLLSKWKFILEDGGLSKYLHIERPEQKAAILEPVFYQKLSNSNFH